MVAVLGVDIGTTNVKAAVFGADGTCFGIGARRQDILAPGIGWREHEPQATWRAARDSMREAVAVARRPASEIDAVAVTGPRGSMLLLSPDGAPTTHVLTWQDRRSADSAALLSSAAVDPEAYYAITGTPLDPSVALARVLWLKAADSRLIDEGGRLATPQGYVLTCLGAPEAVIDYSVAAHMGLFDVAKLKWSETLRRGFDLPPTLLPRAVPPGEVVGA